MQQLQDLDAQIEESQKEITDINTEIDTLMTQIQENEEKLEKIQEEYDNIQDLLDARVIAMYEKPKLQYLEILLTSDSLTGVLSNYYNLKELIESDSGLLDTVRNQKKEIETTKKILAEKKEQIITSKQTQQKKSQVLSNTKKMREYYISKLTEEEQSLQAQIDEYNLQVSEIEAEIKLLALNSISEDYVGGSIRWPVPGYTALTSLYGMRVHPITGAYKLHTGIDISAPLGVSFVAAADGIVTKATFNTAYGNMVIIDHGGGVQTLYAHGSDILVQVGESVSAGTEVLRVGSTGYSTGPHAHFEIRINGQTVDPLDYL
jgi:murein DD-endopeptidase MepM/ murein hydrolase activator NlpD